MIPNHVVSPQTAITPFTIGGLGSERLEMLAQQFDTPLYVYHAETISAQLLQWKRALADYSHTRVCYAVKANGNLKLLDFFCQQGISFDIVSGGELARLRQVGVPGDRIIFSGVGKSYRDIEMAIQAKIHCFNIESTAEMQRLTEIGRAHGVRIPVALRINPDIDPNTHPYISTGLKENKFGLTLSEAVRCFDVLRSDSVLDWQGLDCHIGSNMHAPQPYQKAAETLFSIESTLRQSGIVLSHLDCGGGVGVCYHPDDRPVNLEAFVAPILARAKTCMEERRAANLPPLELIFEPGRHLIGEAGTLLTRVEMVKQTEHRRFVIVDAAMNDLMRPALYQAWHDIVLAAKSSNQWKTKTHHKESAILSEGRCDIVGPICESADFLGKDRDLVAFEGDLLAIKTVGAYAFVMSSNYNARPRSAEVWVENDQVQLVRKRETYDDLYALERL